MYCYEIFLITACLVGVGCEDVVICVLQPDPLCPNQQAMYECVTLKPTAFLEWRHPAFELPEFTTVTPVNTIHSDGAFSATLTKRKVVGNEVNVTSVLTIEPELTSLNGTVLICEGDTTERVEDSITITLSGTPDAPQGLHQNMSFTTESSAMIQWQSPLFTGGGGVVIMSYNITVNGETVNVQVHGRNGTFTYNITGLVYNTNYSVTVTAINSCGQESQPTYTTVFIKAIVSAPPGSSILQPELYCDVPLENGRPVVINWMLREEVESIVYPGVVQVNVKLDPGNIACSNVTTDDTSCIVNITKDDNYTITIALRNDEGVTTETSHVDLNEFQIIDLLNEGIEGYIPTVIVILNPLCRAKNYSITLFFGVMENGNDICEVVLNITNDILPGESAFFTPNITRSTDQVYCYLLHETKENVTKTFDSPDDNGLSVIAIVGIVIGAILLVAIITSLTVISLLACAAKKKENYEVS